MAFICVQALAQDDKVKFGLSFGPSMASFQNDSRESLIKDGWKYDLPFGGRVGADLRIPLFAGVFLKPGVYGEYIRDYRKKESSKEGNMRLPEHKNGKDVYTDYHVINTTRLSNLSHSGQIHVPLALGYTFPMSRGTSVAAGILGYASYLLLSKVTEDDMKRVSSSPYKENLNKTDHDKTDINALEYMENKDRIGYGVGGEVEFRFGHFFSRYRYSLSLKDIDKYKNHIHNISLGFYF